MKFWRWILYGLATYFLIIGLWDHSPRLIAASVAVWVIYPLISEDPDDEHIPVCAGCTKGRIVPGCPVHDPERRKLAA